MQIPASLINCALFEEISSEHLTALLTCLDAKKLSYKKGEVILPEGDAATEIGILLSGRAHIVQSDYYGNNTLASVVFPGQLFAESFACAMAEALPVSVVAAEDSEILFINCARLMTSCSNACEFHNRIIFNLLKITARKNLALHEKNMLTAKRTTREKLLAYLMLQAKSNNSLVFTIPFDRQALADYLGVDRSGLSAELGKLKKEGVLDFFKNSFRLLINLSKN